MSKISDMIISAIVKRGVLWEGRNVEFDFDIPTGKASPEELGPDARFSEAITIHIKADHMQITVAKEGSDIQEDI